MINKLKARWNITSHWQLVFVLLTFSVTGSTTLIVRKFIFELIGITPDTSLWLKFPMYILVIFPIYQALFLIIGFLFGQFRFAWEFEKKMFSRFVPKHVLVRVKTLFL
jgi:hypothetical protein